MIDRFVMRSVREIEINLIDLCVCVCMSVCVFDFKVFKKKKKIKFDILMGDIVKSGGAEDRGQ